MLPCLLLGMYVCSLMTRALVLRCEFEKTSPGRGLGLYWHTRPMTTISHEDITRPKTASGTGFES